MRKLKAMVWLTGALVMTPAAMANIDFPHIEITGVGEVTAVPDMANIEVGVVTERKTAKAAKGASDKAVAAFIERLAKQGVKRDQIESAHIQLSPRYQHTKDKAPELIGYRAERNVTVTLNQLDKLNAVLDGALGEGINRIRQVQLTSSEQSKLKDKAREAAVNDAKVKAKALAESLNMHLDGVWQVRYRSSNPRPVMMNAEMRSGSADVAASYQDMTMQVSDQVDIIFRLDD
ncbi:oxidative stress defense protein [Salinivibrio sp. ES.052]|uniref:oxidative stress defense protein n=1 Tax=Salinivibrio sp. ES.052 TaxID=1882823 RepID=UPI00092AD128|nr:oxidative stress defense protein [Salinivibrio sp. ES.052]SIO42366.1 hypothetical protein SAMN05444724_3348 [Salinivibrio sp. ES.052]